MTISLHLGCRDQKSGCRPMLLMSAVAIACVLASVARAASLEQLRETFRQLDANADGQVSITEFANRKIYVFGLHDTNGDSSVERAEVDLDAHQFHTADKDGDGHISGLEFIEAPIGQFRTYDTDGNGYLTFEELMNGARSSTP